MTIKIEIKSSKATKRLRTIFVDGKEVAINTEGSHASALKEALSEVLEAIEKAETEKYY